MVETSGRVRALLVIAKVENELSQGKFRVSSSQILFVNKIPDSANSGTARSVFTPEE
jgi:hypothetical protein